MDSLESKIRERVNLGIWNFLKFNLIGLEGGKELVGEVGPFFGVPPIPNQIFPGILPGNQGILVLGLRGFLYFWRTLFGFKGLVGPNFFKVKKKG